MIGAAFQPILSPEVCCWIQMNLPSVLCVDDYETSLAGWCLYLQSVGFSVTTARTAQEGLQLFAVSPVDVVLLDYAMPDSNGDEVAAMMKRIKPEVRILMLSGEPNVPEKLASMLTHSCKRVIAHAHCGQDSRIAQFIRQSGLKNYRVPRQRRYSPTNFASW